MDANPISQPLHTDELGEFEFQVQDNGKYSVTLHKDRFNNGNLKKIFITLFNLDDAKYTDIPIFDTDHLILNSLLKSGIYMVDAESDLLPLNTKKDDIGVIRTTGKKYLKINNTHPSTMSDWMTLDFVTSINNMRGDVILTADGVYGFDNKVLSLGNIPNGIAKLDENGLVPPAQIPNYIHTHTKEQITNFSHTHPLNDLVITDLDTGASYTLTVRSGQIQLDPVII
jgi:hypothetical protein